MGTLAQTYTALMLVLVVREQGSTRAVPVPVKVKWGKGRSRRSRRGNESPERVNMRVVSNPYPARIPLQAVLVVVVLTASVNRASLPFSIFFSPFTHAFITTFLCLLALTKHVIKQVCKQPTFWSQNPDPADRHSFPSPSSESCLLLLW